MTDKSPILWRWKGKGTFNEGVVQQEMKDLIKIATWRAGRGFWYLKAEIDIRGYEEKVTG